jgi:hypothetical protein
MGRIIRGEAMGLFNWFKKEDIYSLLKQENECWRNNVRNKAIQCMYNADEIEIKVNKHFINLIFYLKDYDHQFHISFSKMDLSATPTQIYDQLRNFDKEISEYKKDPQTTIEQLKFQKEDKFKAEQRYYKNLYRKYDEAEL